MYLEQETRELLKLYQLKANKKLGQNFLINETIIEDIVQQSEVTKNDVVIEIGPGLGSLTKVLLEKAKKVIAIELDSSMVEILKNRFKGENLEIIEENVLKVNLQELIAKEESVKVVANLPYYITTPIIMKLLEERLPLRSITVMVQKEVGERICADYKQKAYGAITVSIQYYSKASMILLVPKENFLPEPKVDSCVIKLEILEKPPVELVREDIFFRLIQAGFNQRRKNISNSFMSIGLSKEEINQVLEALEIDFHLRAENLSIQDFAKIANYIARNGNI